MAAVSKIEDGVVELRTDVGRLYVCPTSWQRLYLRWTFRNFHTLPHQVLNGRQQRLINKLWRTAIVTPSEAAPPGAIIGVVENMKVLALPSTAEVAESTATAAPAVSDVKLAVVQGSAESVALELNVSEPEIPAPITSASAPAIPESEPAAVTTDNPAKVCAPDVVEKPARPRGYRWILPTLELAGAAAVLLLAIELIPLWKTPQVESGRFAAPPVPPVFAAQLASRAAKASTRASEIGRAPAARNLRAEAALRHPATPSPALPAAAALPQIVEAPQSGFIYPTAPNPNLVGKVVLKAVVGSDGTVKQVEVLSGDRSLAAAAARAVRHWRYAPVEVQGHAVEAETHVTVSFLGDDAVSIILPPSR